MKRPKQLPAVERNSTRSASSVAAAGVRAATLVGNPPSPACRALYGYGCDARTS
jgi:hypothetical protein